MKYILHYKQNKMSHYPVRRDDNEIDELSFHRELCISGTNIITLSQAKVKSVNQPFFQTVNEQRYTS